MSLLASAIEIMSILPMNIPDPDPVTPPGFEAPVGLIIGMLRWGGLALAVVGIIVIAARLTINIRRGEAANELGGLGYVALAVILIGAAAAVGLTRHGWCGRFIELGDMRSLPAVVSVGELLTRGIQVASVDRDPLVPLPQDSIVTGGWLRPSLLAGQAVLQVRADGDGRWVAALGKRGDKAA